MNRIKGFTLLEQMRDVFHFFLFRITAFVVLPEVMYQTQPVWSW